MIVVVLWLVLTLVFGFWTAARAANKGYSFGKYLFLGLVFGVFAWLFTYSLPTKLAGETIGQAGGRTVTTGVLNVAEAAKDAGRARSPGIAKGVGAVATRAAMNAASGAREAVSERRGTVIGDGDADVDTQTDPKRRGIAAGLANRATRTAMNAADGAREAAAERRRTGAGEIGADPTPHDAPPRGLAANLAGRATRTAMNAAEAARKAAADHHAGAKAAQPTAPDAGESVEARLTQLESLRERGLLTDEEHRDRRAAIIAAL